MTKELKVKEGSKAWDSRLPAGRKLIFKDPQTLWDACVEYFEWNQANPLKEEKINFYQGEPTVHSINKMSALTMDGLCVYLEIGQSTWYDYCNREVFSEVTKRVDAIMRNQKFTGAAADLLNANIIARDLGLADKQVQNVTSTGIVVQTEPLSIEDWEKMGEKSQEMINKAHAQLMKNDEQ